MAVGLRFGVSGGMDAMCRLGVVRSGPLHGVLIVSWGAWRGLVRVLFLAFIVRWGLVIALLVLYY